MPTENSQSYYMNLLHSITKHRMALFPTGLEKNTIAIPSFLPKFLLNDLLNNYSMPTYTHTSSLE